MTHDRLLDSNRCYSLQVQALLEELAAYPDEALNRTPPDGGWSAVQTLTHLILSEESALAYVRKKLGFGSTFQRAGWGGKWRSFLLWLALSSPFKFRVPAVVSQEQLPPFATMAQTRARWQQSRAAWEVFFEQMPPQLLDKAVFKHPRAGKIGWGDMLGFFSTHVSRHRQQALRAARQA
ncbi:MAG TPA: DinB family protein [Saprospiraceae bacterium]|nr:DinB family protein [Saprospiraceae bacterium]